MKKAISVLVISAFFTACNEGSVNVEVETDSLNKKLENISEKAGEKLEQAWDTTKAKVSDIKDKAEQKWDSAKDRNKRIDTINKQ